MSRWLNASSAQSPGMLAIWDEDKTDLYQPQFYWSWENRHPTVCRTQGGAWVGLWTAPVSSPNSNSFGLPVSGGWSPWVHGESGYVRLAFFTGTCRDINGNTVSGAVLTAFRTSDNAVGGTTVADSNGVYQLGTIFPGVAHYIVAYLDTTTDLVGTTVNTLIPTSG